MNTDRQIFLDNFTTTGTLLRRVLGVNSYHRPTSIFHFVGGELDELSPGNVGNAFVDGSKIAVLHTPNIQVLKNNQSVLVDQLTRFLMCKVIAVIGLALVGVTQCVNRLTAFGTSLQQTFFLALQSGDVLFVPFHPALAFNLVSARQRGEGSQAKVNTNNFNGWWQRLGFHDTAKASPPITHAVASDSQSLTFSFKRSVQLDLDPADLRKTQLTIVTKAPIAALSWISKAVIAIMGFETRIAWLLSRLDTTEKGAKGQVQAYHCLLHSFSMPIFKPWVFFFPVWQHLDGIISANAFLALFPCFFTRLKSFVVDKATTIKLPIQRGTLGRCWIKSVAKRFTHKSIVSTFCHTVKYLYGNDRECKGVTRKKKAPFPSLLKQGVPWRNYYGPALPGDWIYRQQMGGIEMTEFGEEVEIFIANRDGSPMVSVGGVTYKLSMDEIVTQIVWWHRERLTGQGETDRYLPFSCPICARARLIFNLVDGEVMCEKCGADTETVNAAMLLVRLAARPSRESGSP